MRVFKLKFHSALHVDDRGSGEPEAADEYIRSDTLSAALAISWSVLYPEDGEGIFLHPPFKVSSAFPFVGGALLFPVPVWRIWKTDDVLKRKDMKKVRWISQSLFEQILKGKEIEAASAEVLSGIIAVTDAEQKSHPELEKSSFWVMTERQRVGVRHLTGETVGPFFFALQFFGPDAGLWFAADGDEAVLEKLRCVLNYLGDTGIGADRNSGLGHFKVSGESDFTVSAPENQEGWITLSLFNPSDPASLATGSAYGLTTRSGWISGSTVGRPPIRVFTEGSFFPRRPVGRVKEMLTQEMIEAYDLRIQHLAPRDFRAVCLPCGTPPCLKGGNHE